MTRRIGTLPTIGTLTRSSRREAQGSLGLSTPMKKRRGTQESPRRERPGLLRAPASVAAATIREPGTAALPGLLHEKLV